MATALGFLLTPQPPQTRVMGPAEAPVPRLRDEFRYQILIKATKRSVLRSTVKRLQDFAQEQKWRSTALIIDVDPMHSDVKVPFQNRLQPNSIGKGAGLPVEGRSRLP